MAHVAQVPEPKIQPQLEPEVRQALGLKNVDLTLAQQAMAISFGCSFMAYGATMWVVGMGFLLALTGVEAAENAKEELDRRLCRNG